MTLREAILNENQQLISNIKVGMSAHTNNGKTLTWGNMIEKVHFGFPYGDQTYTTNGYAINDDQ
jgi:hypothetical protein